MTSVRPVFGTTSFYQALADDLNSDSAWLELATAISYSMVHQYGTPVDKRFYVVFKEGNVTEVCELSALEERAVDFVITGAPESWQAILQGRVNPSVAMMTGKLKVQGSQAELVRHMKPFSYLLDKMTQLDPVYPDSQD